MRRKPSEKTVARAIRIAAEIRENCEAQNRGDISWEEFSRRNRASWKKTESRTGWANTVIRQLVDNILCCREIGHGFSK